MRSSTSRKRRGATTPRLERLEERSLLTGVIDGPFVTHGARPAGAPPADFDGDGRSDMAVFRPSTAQWFVRPSAVGASLPAPPFGATGLADVPLNGDFDGDGKTEPAVFRVATGEWFALGPSGGRRLGTFGAPNLADIPVPADYDGDGKTDLAVFRHATGQWFILGPTGTVSVQSYGGPNLMDIPVPADYDGDGKADLAVFRVGTAEWFVKGRDGSTTLGSYGGANLMDVPVPGDYDGDGKAEPAVYRLQTAEWFVKDAGGGRSLGRFGGANALDFPVATSTGALMRMNVGYFVSVLGPTDLPFRRLDLAAVGLHTSYVARARAGETPVLLLGDSIMRRWGTPETGNVGRSSWEAYFAPLGGVNFGIDGDTTQDLLWRVSNGALDGRPAVVVLSIGTNNLGTGAGVDATVRGIGAVITTIQSISPGTKILLMGVLPRPDTPTVPLRVQIAELNARFRGLAKGSELRFVDPSPAFLDATGGVSRTLLPDGIHPGEQGYRVLGQILRAAIDAMLAG